MNAATSFKPLGSSFGRLWVLLLLLLSASSLLVTGEFYSSVDSMKTLGGIESTLLQSFRTYLKLQQEELSALRRFMERIQLQHIKATEDIEDYLGNPINAFTLIKRVVRDWAGVNEVLEFEYVQDELTTPLTQLKESSNLPDERELKGAILGLARLQDIYNLQAVDMANGKGYGSSLNWRECFEIAITYSEAKRCDLAITWLKIASDKLNVSVESTDIKNTFTIQIQENLAYNLQVLGQRDEALKHLKEVIAIQSNHHLMLTKKYLSKLPEESEKYKVVKENDYHSNYAHLCRGQNSNSSRPGNTLKCHLDSAAHPYFILSPLQVEPVHMDPPITVYHNLLNDQQIAQLVNKTKGTLERSQVVDGPGKTVVAEVRVSQQIWIQDTESQTAAFMYRMVSLIARFYMGNVEQIQIANYGIGGQFIPHYDYFEEEKPVEGLNGNRIATNMFYLSDVEKGGYTVFPELNVYLKPVKGSMVMWYNLHKSLEPDDRVLHAGCPVLMGSKRIANIWTRSSYQDTARPCGLSDDRVKL